MLEVGGSEWPQWDEKRIRSASSVWPLRALLRRRLPVKSRVLAGAADMASSTHSVLERIDLKN